MVQVKKNIVFLVSLFFISLIVRLLFFYFFLANNPCKLMYDASHYHEQAVNFVQAPHFYRLPGYPLFLAICYKIFGINVDYALLVQIVLASLLPLLIFFLTRVLFEKQRLVAYLASCVAVFHPGFLIFSGLVMSETLFVLFFLPFLILFFALIFEKYSWQCAVLAGFFLGVASLIRPVGHFAGMTALVLFLLSSLSWHEKIKGVAVGMVAWLGIVGPWLLRNYLLTGYLFFHTLSGVHFLNHSAKRIMSQCYGISYAQAGQLVDDEYKQACDREVRPLQEIEKSLIAEKIAQKYMLLNPLLTIKHFFGNMLKTMFSLYSSELLMIDAGGILPAYDGRTMKDLVKRFLFPQVNNSMLIPFIYFELCLFLFLLLSFAGFVIRTMFMKQEVYKVFVMLTVMMLFVLLSLACGYARLRFPVETLLIIGGSEFLVARLSFYRKESG